MKGKVVYALDFDGVICDSALETGLSGWKAACRIWSDMPQGILPGILDSFRQVRPIIETGYESVLAMRMLYCGASAETLYTEYVAEFRRLMVEAGSDTEDLKTIFGETRDAWIATDKAEWIRENPIYPGVAEKLARLAQSEPWYVITTKQQRFVKLILDASHIDLPEDRIFGLDRKMNKAEVLKLLAKRHSGQIIHFVEDRFQTLQKIKQDPELAGVQLLLAAWGYNTEAEKGRAAVDGITQISLEEFLS